MKIVGWPTFQLGYIPNGLLLLSCDNLQCLLSLNFFEIASGYKAGQVIFQ